MIQKRECFGKHFRVIVTLRPKEQENRDVEVRAKGERAQVGQSRAQRIAAILLDNI